MAATEGRTLKSAAKASIILEASEQPNRGRGLNSLLSNKDNAVMSAR